MKTLSITLCLLLATALSACSKDNNDENTTIEMDNTNQPEMKLTIDTTSFDVALENNSTAKAFVSQLPITIAMNDMNDNEKYGNLSNSLPTNPSKVNTIHKGDIMLFGSNTLVVFYKTFNTSYSYTPIGKISNPSDLETVLGEGSARLTFELSEKEILKERYHD